MKGRGGRAALLASAAVAWVSLVGCGGEDPAELAAAQLAQARTYAAAVSVVTQHTGTSLAAISDRADYRDASAAAESTREYAQTIRAAASALERTTPPEAVAEEHRALVRLYLATATQMDGLATAFAQVRGERALTAKAQELSADVQRYATQELQLRSAIERALPAATTPGTATTPGQLGGPADSTDPG